MQPGSESLRSARGTLRHDEAHAVGWAVTHGCPPLLSSLASEFGLATPEQDFSAPTSRLRARCASRHGTTGERPRLGSPRGELADEFHVRQGRAVCGRGSARGAKGQLEYLLPGSAAQPSLVVTAVYQG